MRTTYLFGNQGSRGSQSHTAGWPMIFCLAVAWTSACVAATPVRDALIRQKIAVARSDVQITGIYSDLCYNAEGGDLLGTEIFIVFADTDDFVAFVQCWEGGTTRPTVVSVEVKEDAISFQVPEPALCAGAYKGRITVSGFDGVWTHSVGRDGTETALVHLKRKHSFWQ